MLIPGMACMALVPLFPHSTHVHPISPVGTALWTEQQWILRKGPPSPQTLHRKRKQAGESPVI